MKREGNHLLVLYKLSQLIAFQNAAFIAVTFPMKPKI